MVRYARSTNFHAELKTRVDEYFRSSGLPQRGLPGMYIKTALILGWCTVSYWLLVFEAKTWWQALPLCLSLALAVAGIGFNIQHDGGHEAYSDSKVLNRLTALTLDAVGGSSWLWRIKHNFIHHSYPNIVGVDTDIDLGSLGHLPPGRPLDGVHRLQFLYLWFLYGLLLFKWQLFDDFRDLVRGRMGEFQFPRPKNWELATLLGGKIFVFTMIFIVPITRHRLLAVGLCYLGASFVVGVTTGVVFQLAHCVEEARFTTQPTGAVQMEIEWALHQVESSVDFARGNRFMTWYLGGLNYQIEHHLFPKICHVHYPALSPIVEQVCAEFGVRYFAHPTLLGALASHYRLLRRRNS
jgi:linoleoyl-CoA desaturase